MGSLASSSALVAALLSAGACVAALAGPAATPRSAPQVAEGWILARFELPLDRSGGEPLWPRAGTPADVALRRARVARVEAALPTALSAPGRDSIRQARFGLDRTYRLVLERGAVWREALAALGGTPGIVWVEPDPVGRGSGTRPDDPRFADQWGLEQRDDHDIDAPEAWDVSQGSADVVVAVIDTGVDPEHPDFSGKLLAGYDFVNQDEDPRDDSGHGSSVASIAAANTNNQASIAGVCWHCSILPLKALDQNVAGFYSWWADALVYAADRGAPVINMSVGGTSGSSLLHDAIRYARDRGAVIVAAMMNDGDATIYYPAAFEETIAVGGTNELDERAYPFCNGGGSNYGPHIDIVAPGDYILGARLGGGESFWCGTSQAAAFVSGLVGLALAVDRSLGREESRYLLRAAAEDLLGPIDDTPGFDFLYGWGRVNAARMLRAVRSGTSLRLAGSASTRAWLLEKSPTALSYDMVRGDVSQLAEAPSGVVLGAVSCLLDDALEPDLAGAEDAHSPPAGGAFFYLVRSNGAPGAGGYGGSSSHRDRHPGAGDCPR